MRRVRMKSRAVQDCGNVCGNERTNSKATRLMIIAVEADRIREVASRTLHIAQRLVTIAALEQRRRRFLRWQIALQRYVEIRKRAAMIALPLPGKAALYVRTPGLGESALDCGVVVGDGALRLTLVCEGASTLGKSLGRAGGVFLGRPRRGFQADRLAKVFDARIDLAPAIAGATSVKIRVGIGIASNRCNPRSHCHPHGGEP